MIVKEGIGYGLSSSKEYRLTKIYDCQRQAFKKLYDKYKDETTSPYKETIKRLTEKFRQKNRQYYLIVDNGVMVRFLSTQLEKRIDTNQLIMRIAPLAILPEYENKGYGKSAMEAAEKLVRIDKIILDTIKQEEKLVSFYQKLGYVEVGTYSIQNGMNLLDFEKTITN
ncbi:GNAT family N-acetyltransferase [Enterococcus villorum]|uniref:N-acetyltransferase n=2 Tax=Enterococcus villorum TaxID=112904 RepID=A0A511J4L8_9ENTE|nr:hypothetical protein UAO_01880 [Enterococcus villorum ATCC 700913]EOW76412.1 hypothetical protein I591_01716 [Enterococcus villorum ATCC 700913]GEL92653.1 N-acetyltransferase [Enterococcus villorum]